MELDRTIKRPAVQFYGSQWNNAPWIARYMPAHGTRVIPFMGGLNEELRLPQAKLTNATDKDGRIVNFFTVLRDRPEELVRAIHLTPWHCAEYELSKMPHEDSLEDARRFWCVCWMSIQGGPRPDKSGFRRLRASSRRWSMPVTDSLNVDHLYDVAKRLRHIHFLEGDGVELVNYHADVGEALVWCDPPFLAETRGSGQGYGYESSLELHERLAAALHQVKGYALVNGYGWNKDGTKNRVYEGLYEAHGWQRVDSERRTNSGGRRVQSIWLSPRTWEALNHGT